jgi:hypothetical protein
LYDGAVAAADGYGCGVDGLASWRARREPVVFMSRCGVVYYAEVNFRAGAVSGRMVGDEVKCTSG